jgi:drug/metabolite transporter (DMT)-like permease
MLWFWITVAGGLFASARSLVSRVIMKDEEESLAYTFIYQAMLALFIIPLLGFGFKLPKTTFPYLAILLVGAFDTLAVYLFLESARFLEASLRKVVMQTQMVWILVFGAVLLQESMEIAKIIGVFLILLGVILAIYRKEEKSLLKNLWVKLKGENRSDKDKGIIFVLSAVTLKAVELVVVKNLLVEFSPAIVAFGTRATSVVCLLLIMKNLRPRVLGFAQRKKGLILTHGLTGTGAFFLFLWATSLAEVSRTAPITSSFSILTILAGIIFLKERERVWQKILGGILAAIGVVLVKGI